MFKRIFGKRKVLAGLAVVTLAAGLLTMTVSAVSAHGGGWFGRGGAGDGALLANELGITVEELQTAQDAARDKAMQQALEAGTISAEQYESFQVGQALRDYIDPQALVAQVLGTSVDELNTLTLSEWLDKLGMDRETFQTKLQEAHAAALQQAVTDGVITQEQADALPDRGLCGGRGLMPGLMGERSESFGGMRDSRGMRGFHRQAPLDDGTLDGTGFRGLGMMSPDQA